MTSGPRLDLPRHRPAPEQPARVFISAGEPSGYGPAAAVVRALRAARPCPRVAGLGGEEMERAGTTIIRRTDDLTVIGLAEIVGRIPEHLRILRRMRDDFAADRYDLAIVVDYPGLHLRAARAAARQGIPVLYYIAPQLWAWGARRAATLRRAVSHIAAILPFEQPYFTRLGIPTTFVGHPLLDRARPPTSAAAREALGVARTAPVLGLFPGSRDSEIARLWPIMRDAARLVRHTVGELEVVVATLPGRRYPESDEFLLAGGDSMATLRACDAVLCKSGTSTLEAALIDIPMVVTYRMHPLTHAIARRVVRCRHIGLVNILAGREVSPEFVQDAATPAALAAAALQLLDRDGPFASAQRAAFPRIRARLGRPGAARRVAALAEELME